MKLFIKGLDSGEPGKDSFIVTDESGREVATIEEDTFSDRGSVSITSSLEPEKGYLVEGHGPNTHQAVAQLLGLLYPHHDLEIHLGPLAEVEG
jgi:hypothetical protein